MTFSLKKHLGANRWEIHFSLTNPESKFQEVWGWCWDVFGHPGTDPDTGIKSAWDYHGGYIYLFDKESVLMFSLRWT